LPVKDRISFDQVSFSYPSRPKSRAIDNISFDIGRGSMVALVGETGGGKTTLADLLMGLIEPTAGQILVDGVPLDVTNAGRWQGAIAHVPQSIFLADATIARNIALSLPDMKLDHDRVVDAARKAQLYDFVCSLPEGFDTHVGERGIRLSGGQRQRLGIARAIYKNTPILVFDEATSALDDLTETAVITALEELRREGRTIIIVAHRLSTIRRCDLVARLDRGRLVELGGFEEVLGARANLS
jgi:ATP-binding cassette subfamily B protein